MRNLRFRKSGKEIKEAIKHRNVQLTGRLLARNNILDQLLENKTKIRSYMLRNTENNRYHGHAAGPVLFSKDDISSEEKDEIQQLCRRIFEIEQEIHRLALVSTHLIDDQQFDLEFDELVSYGFEPSIGTE